MTLIFIIILVAVALLVAVIMSVKIAQLKKFSVISKSETNNIIDKYLIFSSMIIIPITILFDTNYIRYKAPIPFSSIDNITFADFRGLIKLKMKISESDKIATIVSNIRVKKSGNTIYVESFFYPTRSYVYYKNLFSNVLLKHEMYHFRITEYHARMMRQEIGYTPGTRERKTLNMIKYYVSSKEAEMQNKYDTETEHNLVQSKQIEWQNKIDSLLISLDGYSETVVTLK